MAGPPLSGRSWAALRRDSPMRPVLKPSPIALSLLLVLPLAGCALGPDYRAPDTAAGETYGADPLPIETASTPVIGGEAQRFLAGQELPERWWTLFGSEHINALVNEALANSPSVASAEAALRQAQFTASARGADLYPVIEGSVGGVRQKIDTGSFGNPGAGSTIYNLFNAQVSVNYGIDLFGGTRRGIEAVLAEGEFQRYQSEAAYRTLIANVVTTAVQEALLRRLIAGQQSILDDQQKTLKVSEAQFDLGAIGKAELLSAKALLATERAKLPALRAQLSKTQNLLAVYLGRLPSQRVTASFELEDLKLPQELPVSVPSTLVQRRPDVLAADAALRGASAGIGIAAANRLPRLALSASYGTQSAKPGDLFKGDVWSIGGNFIAPLVDFGGLKNSYRGARAAYERSAADYRLTVLNAFRDVADALRQLEMDAEALKAQHEASEAAAEGLKLAQLQYELGATSYLQLLSAQQQRIQARTGFTQALAARHQDTVALFQALGGSWATPLPAREAPAPVAAQ